MGIQSYLADLFGQTSPAPDTPQVDEPRGASGRYHTGGFLQWDERNTDLQGRSGLRVFEKMWRSDADIRRALTLCFNPIVGASVSIEPYGTEDDPPTPLDEQVAQFVQWNLMEYMRPKYKAHVWAALTVAGRAGFAPFEQVYSQASWQGRDVLALARLDLRLPRSVYRWPQKDGVLQGIEQYALPNAPASIAGQPISINAANLVYYRFGAEGDNWEGQPLIRPAYKHWKYKDAIELIEAIGIEKFAIGTPVAYPPRGATQGQLDALETALANWRANENQYLMLPGPKQDVLKDGEGWLVEILTPQESRGSEGAVEAAKQYHSDKIASVVIAEFMRQGMKNVGAKATSETQQDPFLAYCETIADIIVEDTLNEQLIPRLVDLNFTVPPGRYPRLKLSVIDDTSIAELSMAVSALANVGAIRVEPTLEAHLRKVMDLPPADETAISQIEQAKQEEAQQAAAMLRRGMVDGPDGKPAAPTDPPTRLDANPGPPHLRPATTPQKRCGTCRMFNNNRCWGYGNTPVQTGQVCDSHTPSAGRTLEAAGALKAHEQHMSLGRIASAIDGARDEMQAGTRAAVRALAADVSADPNPQHAAPPPDLVDAVNRQLEALYATGRVTVAEELARQRRGAPAANPTLLAADPGPAHRTIRQRAIVIASGLRAAVVNAAQQARLRPGQPDIQRAALDAATLALKTAAVDNASAALNAGRADEALSRAHEIEGARYTSVLDGNSCDVCTLADDDVLRPLDDPTLPDTPNPECDGGDRCRCMLAYQLVDEQPASA